VTQAPTRIALLGDSNVLAITSFWSDFVRDHEVSGVALATKYFRDVREESRDFTFVRHDGRTELHPWVRDDLAEVGIELAASANRDGPWLVLQLGAILCYERLILNFGDTDFTIDHPFSGNNHLVARLVPREIVERRVSEELEPTFRGLELLAGAFPGKLAVFPAPPPDRDNARLEATIAQVTGARLPAPPPSVRLKVQWLYHQLLREGCARRGLLFHDTWQATASSDGFIDPRFAFDGFHANARYGGNVLMAFCDRYLGAGSRFPYSGPWNELGETAELELARAIFGATPRPAPLLAPDRADDAYRQIDELKALVRLKDEIIQRLAGERELPPQA